jgi:hypothetical protein
MRRCQFTAKTFIKTQHNPPETALLYRRLSHHNIGEAKRTKQYDRATDGRLVSLTLAGETEAFGELVRRYKSAVIGTAARVLRERGAAEDCAQDYYGRRFPDEEREERENTAPQLSRMGKQVGRQEYVCKRTPARAASHAARYSRSGGCGRHRD